MPEVAHGSSQTDLDPRLREAAERLDVPGAGVGIYHEGAEHYAFYGVGSIENPIRVDESTLFQFGSTAKTYTATAMMILVERGLVDLDERVQTYVPELKLKNERAAREVTVLNLLNHTAGWEGDFHEDTGEGDDALEKYVERMSQLEQRFEVGADVAYNNAAFSLAGRVIEKVTGKTYESAIQELILEPLGLHETFFFPSDIMSRKFAVGHNNQADGSVTVARPWGSSRGGKPAGSNVVSNVADQIKWARFHLGEGRGVDGSPVLSRDLIERMQQPTMASGSSGLADYIGISWMLENVEGSRIVGHGGSGNGHQSALEMVPEADFAIAVLTNADPNGWQLHRELVRWALETHLGLIQRDPEPLQLSDSELEKYVGVYETAEVIAHISAEAGGLTIKLESKEEDSEEAEQLRNFPPFQLTMVAGGEEEFVVAEGPAKGLKGFFAWGDTGAVEALHIGGRIATKV